ncbi:MAG: hypothetical protein U0930_11725 [Pirellulales bacterium]
MAFLLPNSRFEIRSVLPVSMLIVSLLGTVASAECGDHLKASFHDFWVQSANKIGESSIDWTEWSSRPGRSVRLSESPNKTPSKQNVCWSCRGATPTSHTTISLDEFDQQIVLVATPDNSQTVQVGFGLPINHSAEPIDLLGPLLRPPIV